MQLSSYLLVSYMLAIAFNNVISGNQSRLSITICATECTGKESRLSQCQLKSCKDSALYQLPCKKENVIGIQCSKFYTLYATYLYRKRQNFQGRKPLQLSQIFNKL